MFGQERQSYVRWCNWSHTLHAIYSNAKEAGIPCLTIISCVIWHACATAVHSCHRRIIPSTRTNALGEWVRIIWSAVAIATDPSSGPWRGESHEKGEEHHPKELEPRDSRTQTHTSSGLRMLLGYRLERREGIATSDLFLDACVHVCTQIGLGYLWEGSSYPHCAFTQFFLKVKFRPQVNSAITKPSVKGIVQPKI